MVNTVLNAMSTALGTTFGSGYHYYKETMEQHTKKPCFNLGVLNPLNRSVNRKDYYRTVPCVIQYFSGDRNATREDCYAIGEQVLECLEYLTVGGRVIRAEDMSYTMVDDVLQIFLTYRFWTTKPETLTNMEDLAGVKSSIN